MLAVDTNVIVRLLTGDDEAQARIAASLFKGQEIWISKTVLLETAWVLSDPYGYEKNEIVEALRSLLGLSNVVVDDLPGVTEALRLAAEGVDLADAVHVTARPFDIPFVTFDRNLAKRAARAGASGVSLAK